MQQLEQRSWSLLIVNKTSLYLYLYPLSPSSASTQRTISSQTIYTQKSRNLESIHHALFLTPFPHLSVSSSRRPNSSGAAASAAFHPPSSLDRHGLLSWGQQKWVDAPRSAVTTSIPAPDACAATARWYIARKGDSGSDLSFL